MDTFFTHVFIRLTKHYNLKKDEAQEMLNDEWAYVESAYDDGNISPEAVARELVCIYMVA